VNKIKVSKSFLGVLVLAISLGVILAASVQQSAEEMYEAAVLKKDADGDMEGAIKIFREIVERYPDNVEIAAKAQLQIGICYEKLGQKSIKEAQAAFQKVLDNYPGQKEAVKRAKEKLSRILKARAVTEGKDETVKIRQLWAGPSVDLYGKVSPDGRYLSFVDWETGDLAIRDIRTGKDRRLTNKGSWQESIDFVLLSRWSPDSKQIVYDRYIEDRTVELRIVGLDGSEPRILYRCSEGGWAQVCDWSPDAKEVLALVEEKGSPFHVAAISVKDGSKRILKNFDASWEFLPEFSPDGKYIVYDLLQSQDTAKGDIFLLSVDGEQDVPLIEHPADDRIIAWTPDGKGLLFLSDRTGSRDAWLAYVVDGKVQGEPHLIKSGIGQIAPLGFAPDGAFYYGLARKSMIDIYISRVEMSSGNILPPSGKLEKRIEGINRAPRFSPDGEYLAYISEKRRIYQGLPVICIRTLASGKVKDLPVKLDRIYGLRWSPDGKSLLLTGRDGEEKNQSQDGWLYQFDISDGRLTPLVQKEWESVMGTGPWSLIKGEWAPDGKGIYYVYTERGAAWKGSIFYRDLEKRTDIELYSTPPDDNVFFSLSNDGKWLAMINRDSRRSLQILPSEGGKPRELLRYENAGEGMPSIAWTPDDKYIYFTRQLIRDEDKRSVWRIPSNGGKPEIVESKLDILGGLSLHPDGNLIAFQCHKIGKPAEIWVMENFLPKKK
jgi:Tol biopolymer transport system component